MYSHNVFLLESKIGNEHPKGEPREMFISMMFNVQNFCKRNKFDINRTGATLSVFYLTHIYTTSKYDLSSEKVFSYFKELLFCHTLPFPPYNSKVFTHKETMTILEFFFKIYLRNLPLIRLLCLPNFAFTVVYGQGEPTETSEAANDDGKSEEKRKKGDKKTGKRSDKKKKK